MKSIVSNLQAALFSLLILSVSACAGGTLAVTDGDTASGQANAAGARNLSSGLLAGSASGTAGIPTFFMGVLPDYDNASTNGVAGFITRTSVVPTAGSGYVNVGPGGSIETSTGIGYIDEAKKNNVPIISLSLTARQSGALSTAQLAGIKAMVAEAQKQNVELWLRYGYEMNFGGGDGQFANINEHNKPADFIAQWAQVAAIANPQRNAASPVKMFWSPNIQSGGDLDYTSWLPADVTTIDVVGVDYYHASNNAIAVGSIQSDLASIYAIAKAHNLPFVLGETGLQTQSTDSSEAAIKLSWLSALSNPSLRTAMPLYRGFFYFDYIKQGTNFSLSQDKNVVPLFQAFYKKQFATATAGTSGTAATSSSASNANTIGSGDAQSGNATANGNTVNGLQQSGTGWSGDLALASTSAQYQALSLDEMLAKKSPMAQALAKFPAVEAAIRQVAAKTGVPDGLLAGVAYQESSFDVKALSINPDDASESDVGLTQAPMSAFSGTTWQDPATNLTYFATELLRLHNKYQSWGAALRDWNSGSDQVNLQNLSSENNKTDANYIKEILGTHCLGLD